MNDSKASISPGINQNQKLAKPLHLQRLEASLDMNAFMSYAHKVLSQPLTSSESENSDVDVETINAGDKFYNGIKTSKTERRNDKMYIYNFSQVGTERKWLQDVLLSDTESESDISDEDECIREMLKNHVREQKFREMYYKTPNNSQYGYYGTGMLSNYDMFPEHQRSIVGVKKRRKEREKKEKPIKPPKVKKQNQSKIKIEPNSNETDAPDAAEWDENLLNVKEEPDDDIDSKPTSPLTGPLPSKRGRKKGSLNKTPEVMAARRRKVWQLMAKKELGKVQRAKANNHKEMLQSCKRVATMCMKIIRQRAMSSQKLMKETVWRAKRLTREMQGYWKRYDRVERETRRRMEKEAEEQRKLDVEIIEAKRQQRKLNFLITQTELYAHFMSKKLGHGTEEEQLRILNQLDEEVNPRLAAIDDYNSELMKQRAQKYAAEAFNAERSRTQEFDAVAEPNLVEPTIGADGMPEYSQPAIFKGVLKGYQLKGMTWLANLYDQGISGILADEMGLGKTVQSIAFLCHIAERYGVWGPFLIISPASTLHNWQQEMQRFVPDFNVVPYWGSPNERKILRQFWEQKDLHTKDASFHVVITSYQLVVSDYKYFNRIKWQYMVLDEAQAIKSSSSVRWKLLLGFNCRNRLLLSGTPIQNSMAELWALLHFIMPTLFDSHEEFNEWFSKDIESHAENKTGIDEKQISRLHMILKPFMLRRIKKDVENELSDKIEIMVYCPLTTRQKLLYMALKKKIRIEDLLHFTVGGDYSFDKNFTSNLMNLVMQFRKVCNHPELFERRDAKSPFAMKCQEYVIPRLIFDDGMLVRNFPSKRHLLYNKFSIYKTENVQRSLFPKSELDKEVEYSRYVDLNLDSAFSFTRFCNQSPNDLENFTLGGLIFLLKYCEDYSKLLRLLAHRYVWWKEHWSSSKYQLLEPTFERVLDKRLISFESVLNLFLFTGMTVEESTVYTFGNYQVYNMQETIEHRVIRSRKRIEEDVKPIMESPKNEDDDEPPIVEEVKTFATPTRGRPPSKIDRSSKTPPVLLPEFPYIPRPPKNYISEPLQMPKFLYGFGPKAQAYGRRLYCDSRAAAWTQIRHEQCENSDGHKLITHSLELCKPNTGWSYIAIPDKQTLISDAGKLSVLDNLLTRLKAQGHRVLIYSQMTKMIDLLEEYMWHRKHRYMRLDGSSKISARRDMVADFQSRADIFVFLLSTRAGGLGINLTAADTVIFYDSDWNPTVDQQAMDRAHRLGQTKQVTVYRLICKGTIEERILQRAREKSEIQRMVISGGNFKPDTLKPKEVVSLLLDDEEIEVKFRQKTEERKNLEDANKLSDSKERKRKMMSKPGPSTPSTSTSSLSLDPVKKPKLENSTITDGNLFDTKLSESGAVSPAQSEQSQGSACGTTITTATNTTSSTATPATATTTSGQTTQNANLSDIIIPGATIPNDESSNEALVVDCDDSPNQDSTPVTFSSYGAYGRARRRHTPRGTKRGRPRGSRRGGGTSSLGRTDTQQQQQNISSPSTSISTSGQSTGVTTTPTSGTTGSNGSNEQLTNTGEGSFTPVVPPVKRGPGRPRLKPGGPPHQGYRGTPRTRKPIGPLVVPLGQSPAATPLTRSPAMSPSQSPAAERGVGYYQQTDDDI